MWTKEGPASIVVLFLTHCVTYLLSLSQFLIKWSGYAWMHSQITSSWCSGCYPHGLVGNDSRVLPEKSRCVVTCRTNARCFQVNSCLAGILFVIVTDFLPCQVGSATGNHFGSLLASRFRRPTWRNGYPWVMILPDSSAWRIFPRWYRVLVTKIKPPNKSYPKKHLQHQDQRGSLMLPPGNLLSPRVLHSSGKELRHHCSSLPRPRCNFIHPKQLILFLNAWSCRFQVKKSCRAMRILSPRAQTNSPRG